MASTPARAKRTPYTSMADQLYPEDDQQDPVDGPEEDGPEEDGEGEQSDASGASPVKPLSQQEMADKVYPADAKGKDGVEDADGEDEDSEDEGDSGDDGADDDGQPDQEKDGAAHKGKTEPKVINGSRSESYDTYVKTGGSRSWRNNNPGNIEYHGQEDAVGVEKGGRFAKYATPEAGMNALKNLLGTVYKDMPVTAAMKKYAPGKDKNDPEAYAKFLEKHGVDLKKPVGKQVDAMAEAIKKQEGWIEGSVSSKK